MDNKLSWQSLPGNISKGNHHNLYFLVFQMQKECLSLPAVKATKHYFFNRNGATTYIYMNRCINIFMQREEGGIWKSFYTPSKPPAHPERRTTELCGTWGAPGAQMARTKCMLQSFTGHLQRHSPPYLLFSPFKPNPLPPTLYYHKLLICIYFLNTLHKIQREMYYWI